MPQRDAIETSFRTKPSSSHQAGSNDGGGKPSDTQGRSIYKWFVLHQDSLGVWHPHTPTFQTLLNSCPQQQSNQAWAVQALENKMSVSGSFWLHMHMLEKSNVAGLERPWAKPPSSPWPSISAALKQAAATQIRKFENPFVRASRRILTIHHPINKPFLGHFTSPNTGIRYHIPNNQPLLEMVVMAFIVVHDWVYHCGDAKQRRPLFHPPWWKAPCVPQHPSLVRTRRSDAFEQSLDQLVSAPNRPVVATGSIKSQEISNVNGI